MGRYLAMKNCYCIQTGLLPLLLLLKTFSATSAQCQLTPKPILDAKQVHVSFFDSDTGRPALRLSYSKLERSRPMIGPITLNYHFLKVEDLQLQVDLDQPNCASLSDNLLRLTNDNSARFILASPVELLTSQKNQTVHQIKADRAKILRDGTINLNGNVKWSGATSQGQLQSATFRKPTTWNGWILENKVGEAVAEIPFQN